MQQAKRYKIEEKGDFELIFGSGDECDYCFKEFKGKISLKHASLRRSDDRLFIKDLNSEQGTFVNGRRLGGKEQEITLHDVVMLGEIEIEIGPTLLLGRARL